MSTDGAPRDELDFPASVAHPALGWALAVAGTLAGVAAFLTWQTGSGGFRLTGIEQSDGWVSFWVGLVLAAAGALVVARRGRPWICTIAFVAAVLLAILFRIDENGVHTSTEAGTTVGVGLWLVGIAAVIGAAAALTGFAVRRRR